MANKIISLRQTKKEPFTEEELLKISKSSKLVLDSNVFQIINLDHVEDKKSLIVKGSDPKTNVTIKQKLIL